MAETTPGDLHRGLRERTGELVVIDVREEGVFAAGHLLLAANIPLSRLELALPRKVPRQGTPIVLCDDDDGLAEQAREVMTTAGYRDVRILAGGVPAWVAAGFELFSGVFVPSKAFGEFVEAELDTPRISAGALARLAERGTGMVILDSRPFPEYRRMNIPGGINVPGAELVHRVKDLAPDPETLVVVNCAGRTRSIIGAQSLINAGLPNRVVALENGTMGWVLAGQDLETGQDRQAPPPSAEARAWARRAADRVAARCQVESIDRATLAHWQAERTERTLYLLDVRAPAEYEAGHLPGALCSPGGQLVQSTDAYAPVLGARLVLVDDDGVRAKMTASWLRQMGRDHVYVLAEGIGEEATETGPEPKPPALARPRLAARDKLGPDDLAAMIEDAPVTILDLAGSRYYLRHHIPGAWFIIRSRIAADLARIPVAERVVLTSPDGTLAALALDSLRALVTVPVQVLDGGTEAWRAAGRATEAGPGQMASERDDVYLLPYDHPPDRIEAAMRDYLDWETSLLAQIERDATARFSVRSLG